MITLKTLDTSVTAITLEDFGAIEIGAHPSQLELEDDYGLTLEEVLASDELKAHIVAARLTLEVDGVTVPLSDFGDRSAGLTVDPFRTVADDVAKNALVNLREGDIVLQSDIQEFFIYDGDRLVSTLDPNKTLWSDLSDPLIANQSFIVSGIGGVLASGEAIGEDKTYQFIVPAGIANEAKGGELNLAELSRYELVGEVSTDLEIIDFVQLDISAPAGESTTISGISLTNSTGSPYASGLWQVTSGTSSAIPLGTIVEDISATVPAGSTYSIRLAYIGADKARGLRDVSLTLSTGNLRRVLVRTDKSTYSVIQTTGTNNRATFNPVLKFTSEAPEVAAVSQWDNATSRTELLANSGLQAYINPIALSGGQSFSLNAATKPDNYEATIINNSGEAKTIICTGLQSAQEFIGGAKNELVATTGTYTVDIPTDGVRVLRVSYLGNNPAIKRLVVTDSNSSGASMFTESDALLGQIFFSTTNRVRQGLCYAGRIYSWSNNPKLKDLFDANNHDFITDNGNGTFTVADHNDFIRAGSTNIGTHVDDTTAVNGLRIRFTDTGAGGGRNPTSQDAIGNGFFNDRFNELIGDPETAPDHRNAYFGIYGDLATITAEAVEEVDIVDIDDVVYKLDEWTGNTVVTNSVTIDTGMDWRDAAYVEITMNDPNNTNEANRHKTYRGDIETIKGTNSRLLMDRYENQYVWAYNFDLENGTFRTQIVNGNGWRITRVTLFGYRNLQSLIAQTLDADIDDTKLVNKLAGQTIESVQDLAEAVDRLPFASILYVDTDNGDDANPGTMALPFKSLAPAQRFAANLVIFVKGAGDTPGLTIVTKHVTINAGWFSHNAAEQLTDNGGRFTGNITSPLRVINASLSINNVFPDLNLTPPSTSINRLIVEQESLVYTNALTLSPAGQTGILSNTGSEIFIEGDITLSSDFGAVLQAMNHSKILLQNKRVITSDTQTGRVYFEASDYGYIHIGNQSHRNANTTITSYPLIVADGGIIQRSATSTDLTTEYPNAFRVGGDGEKYLGWADNPVISKEIEFENSAGGIFDIPDNFPSANEVSTFLVRNSGTTGDLTLDNVVGGKAYVAPGDVAIIHKSGSSYYAINQSRVIERDFTVADWTADGQLMEYSFSDVAINGQKPTVQVLNINNTVVDCEVIHGNNTITIQVNRYPNQAFAGKLLLTLTN